MAFTPNMSNREMAEYDERRGHGDTDLFANPTIVTAKKPWQNPDGTHKSQIEDEKMTATTKAIALLKGVTMPGSKPAAPAAAPSPAPAPTPHVGGGAGMMSPNAPKQARNSRGQVINNPFVKNVGDDDDEDTEKAADTSSSSKRSQQASSQRASQRAQGRKERQIQDRYMTHKGGFSPIDGKLEGLKKVYSSAAAPAGISLPAGSKTGVPSAGGSSSMASSPKPPRAPGTPPPSPPGVAKPSSSGIGAQHTMRMSAAAQETKDEEDEGLADKLFGKSMDTRKAAFLKSLDGQRDLISKALNSKSLHVLPPTQPYDPFNVMRSARTIPTHSADVRETNQHHVRPETIYKSCSTHGITYRAESGCQPCKVHKSSTCAKCGDSMTKKAGGMLACSHGH
jgi:hypothetical protein